MTILNNQIPIKIVQTEKFKTISISVFFKSTMEESRVAARSLLSKMMIKRTSQFKTEKALLDFLSEYYGAHVTSSSFKRGSDHVVSLRMEFVNDKFILEDLDVLNPVIELLKDIIHSPSDYNEETQNSFDKELRLYRNHVKSYQDNRSQKSFEQMMNVMFEGHPMRVQSYGTLEGIESLTLESVQNEYKRLIDTDEVAVVVVGDIDESIKDKLNLLVKRDEQISLTDETYTFSDALTVKNSFETMSIEQARINMGFTMDVKNKVDRINLSAMNQMFGGSINSLLFMNVREHLSLSYEIFSMTDVRNGFLHVLAGVDNNNVEIAKEAILKEFERLRNGEFEQSFVDESKMMMLVNRQESLDNPSGLTQIAYDQLITGNVTDYEQLLQHVTKESIIDIANRLHLNTVHVLSGGKLNGN